MINHNLLNEYDINVKNVEKHYDTSKQVKKYVDAITDENEKRYKKMEKIPKLKLLLKNLENWYCNCCDTQLNSITSYTRHLNSPQHKEKETGEKMVSCSNPKCRKKMMENELENHLKLNPQCVKVSPKNKHIVEMVDIKEKTKKTMNRFQYLNNKAYDKTSIWTEEELQEYNTIIKNGTLNDDMWERCEYTLEYDTRGVLMRKQNSPEEIKKQKLNTMGYGVSSNNKDLQENKELPLTKEEQEELDKHHEYYKQWEMTKEENEKITNENLERYKRYQAYMVLREIELNDVIDPDEIKEI